jgi:hypothetical protein
MEGLYKDSIITCVFLQDVKNGKDTKLRKFVMFLILILKSPEDGALQLILYWSSIYGAVTVLPSITNAPVVTYLSSHYFTVTTLPMQSTHCLLLPFCH